MMGREAAHTVSSIWQWAGLTWQRSESVSHSACVDSGRGMRHLPGSSPYWHRTLLGEGPAAMDARDRAGTVDALLPACRRRNLVHGRWLKRRTAGEGPGQHTGTG